MDLKEKAFSHLTFKQQDVWRICMQEGGSQYRCARILKITRNAVKDRLNKAKKRFKNYVLEASGLLGE